MKTLILKSIGLFVALFTTSQIYGAETNSVNSSKQKEDIIKSILSDLVQIPGKEYKMGKTEVTQFQWEAIMGNNPSSIKNGENPVDNVSWDDCQDFLQKLNGEEIVEKADLAFRLPTIEEWEFSCRAGSMGDYCLLKDGTEIKEETLGDVAWYKINSNGKPHPVGQKKPNAFGLYDMHGNVGEWTQTAEDKWNKYVRGGNFGAVPKVCVAVTSWSMWHDTQSEYYGFRLCASPITGRDVYAGALTALIPQNGSTPNLLKAYQGFEKAEKMGFLPAKIAIAHICWTLTDNQKKSLEQAGVKPKNLVECASLWQQSIRDNTTPLAKCEFGFFKLQNRQYEEGLKLLREAAQEDVDPAKEFLESFNEINKSSSLSSNILLESLINNEEVLSILQRKCAAVLKEYLRKEEN